MREHELMCETPAVELSSKLINNTSTVWLAAMVALSFIPVVCLVSVTALLDVSPKCI